MEQGSPTSVYLYYDEHQILLYVGITSRGSRRQAEHNGDKEWWQYVDQQAVEHYETRREAAARERTLIDLHRPPFNVQGNPDHVATRAAYIAFRQAFAGFTDALDLVRHHDKRVPLYVIEESEGTAILATPPQFAPVAAQMARLKGSSTVLAAGIACGRIERIQVHGPTAFVTIVFQKRYRLGEKIEGRLKIEMGKRGEHTYRLWRVVIANHDEVREMQKEWAA